MAPSNKLWLSIQAFKSVADEIAKAVLRNQTNGNSGGVVVCEFPDALHQ